MPTGVGRVNSQRLRLHPANSKGEGGLRHTDALIYPLTSIFFFDLFSCFYLQVADSKEYAKYVNRLAGLLPVLLDWKTLRASNVPNQLEEMARDRAVEQVRECPIAFPFRYIYKYPSAWIDSTLGQARSSCCI